MTMEAVVGVGGGPISVVPEARWRLLALLVRLYAAAARQPRCGFAMLSNNYGYKSNALKLTQRNLIVYCR